jgi:uncharacterized repeat protein (TIGR03803 family)
MNVFRISIAAVTVFAIAGMAGPAGAQAGDYKEIYKFKGATAGQEPASGLISVNGILYGTTYGGGTTGNGTVFRLKPSTGKAKIVYSFREFDGQYPVAGLINMDGTLYGTTSSGGTYNNGTVFSLNLVSGVENVLHAFTGGSDGDNPLGSLVNVSGTLYGTTQNGGPTATICPAGCGTVFAIDPKTGAEKIVHAFQGGSDGLYPQAGLINVGGTLYGTTKYGGPTANLCGSGCGTVFSVDPTTGAEKIVYAFQGNGDGAYPLGSLVKIGHTLYGTTDEGGTDYNLGTVFALTPKTGAHMVLHAFRGSTGDGQYPYGSLTNVGGTLYGTTSGGGGSPNCNFSCGVVFSVDPNTSAEKVLYIFQGGSDGGVPAANVTQIGAYLYGTTTGGGDDKHCSPGCGTVFSLQP